MRMLQTFFVLFVPVAAAIGIAFIFDKCMKKFIRENVLVVLDTFLAFVLVFTFAIIEIKNLYVVVESEERTEIVEQDVKQLMHLTTSNSIKGDIYLTVGSGSGEINSNVMYSYFEKNSDGSYELKQIDSSGVKIIETNDEEPNIKKVIYRRGIWEKLKPTWFGKLLNIKESEGWKAKPGFIPKGYDEVEETIISIPVGSISNVLGEE